MKHKHFAMLIMSGLSESYSDFGLKPKLTTRILAKLSKALHMLGLKLNCSD